ncbi:MAG: hypothetical protein QG670_1437 [Thermoproteota archaeon]|nr:hypothetical protein [Thermoproteota archaeon]
MATKKGSRYKCDECGIVVMVEDECGCNTCDIVCCGAPMKEVKTTAKTTTKK